MSRAFIVIIALLWISGLTGYLIGSRDKDITLYVNGVSNYTVKALTSEDVWKAMQEYCYDECVRLYFKTYPEKETIEGEVSARLTYVNDENTSVNVDQGNITGKFVCECEEDPEAEIKKENKTGVNIEDRFSGGL